MGTVFDPSSNALVIFADLQAGTVERVRTLDREAHGRGVTALAELAAIFDMPVIVSAVAGADGGAPELIPEIEATLGPVERSWTVTRGVGTRPSTTSIKPL